MILIRNCGEQTILSNSREMIPLIDLLCMNENEKRLVWVERKKNTYDAFGTGWAFVFTRVYDTDADIIFLPITNDPCSYIYFSPVERYGATYACYDCRPKPEALPWFKQDSGSASSE